MKSSGRFPFWILGWTLCILASLGCNQQKTPIDKEKLDVLSGIVTGQNRPLEDAIVKIKGKPNQCLTNEKGEFNLAWPNSEQETIITVAKKDFFIGGVAITNPRSKIEIELKRIPRTDDASYEWVDPRPNPLESENCGNCHQQIFEEWNASAHATAANGQRFLNLYHGTDWHGNTSVGWSLAADHPNGAGVCLSCHAPAAEEAIGFGTLDDVDEVASLGVHCDFCHKVQDVSLETLGITHGRFGMQLLRPHEGQLFFGPLPDVDRDEDVFLPAQSRSEFCASCHEGIVFGVHVYSTYSEWKTSESAKRNIHCQNCHMKPTGEMTNIAPGQGGIERDPKSLASHRMYQKDKFQMIRDCLTVNTTMESDQQNHVATVAIQVDHVGHRVPTGFIDRHLILVAEGFDEDQKTVLGTGQTLPAIAGELAGRNGNLFAKRILGEDASKPHPFWRPSLRSIDSRLQPDTTFRNSWKFPRFTKTIRVRLLYRRFWEQVAKEKGWPDNELVIYDQRFEL